MENAQFAHESEYSKKPEVISVANGRFHLIGEHSWFCKDKTLSMTVNMPVYIAVSRREDSLLKFYFCQTNERKRSNLAAMKFKKEDKWANALKAMIFGFDSIGFEVTGMNFTIYSDILPSAGFGITTAIKVAVSYALNKLYDFKCSDEQILKVIELGNKLFLNRGNYIADNFAAIYAKEDSVILTDHAYRSFKIIPFHFKDKTIMLTDTKVRRVSLWNEDSIRQLEHVLLLGELKTLKSNVYGGWTYEDNPVEVNEVLSLVSEDIRRRLLCIMKEHTCVLDALKAIFSDSFGGFARAVNRSYESLRDLYDISCPEIDWILKRLQKINPKNSDIRNPSSCGRITGKGFGRCVYTIMNSGDVADFKNKLSEYEKIFGFHPECYEVKPAGGAGFVDVE